MSTNEMRQQALLKVLEHDRHSIEDYDEGCEEDLRPYFGIGAIPLPKFVCVTVNWEHAEGKYFYVLFNRRDEAMARCEEFVQDDLFTEAPVKVINLDTGDFWYPIPSYRWALRHRADA